VSISTFQEKIIKGGCGMAVLIGCAAVMFGGIFYTSCAGNPRAVESENQAGVVALTVGGVPVYANEINQRVDEERTRLLQAPTQGGVPRDAVSPAEEAAAYGSAIRQAISLASYSALARQTNVTPDAIVAAAEREISQQITQEFEMQKMIAGMNTGQGSPPPKPAEAEQKALEAFKARYNGKTPDELKQDSLKQIRELAQTDGGRAQLLKQFGPALLTAAQKSKMSVSDADLRRSYDTITAKRILAKTEVPGSQTPEQRLQRAEADLKAGQPFERVMERYSNEAPTPGQKLTDTTVTLTGRDVMTDPNLKPLASLKAGQVSPIVSVPEGKAIYKIVSIKSNLPKDFDKEKAKYQDQYLQGLASAEVQKQMEAFSTNPSNVKIVSPGFVVANDYQQIQSGLLGKFKSVDEALRDLAARAKAAAANKEAPDARVANLVHYASLEALSRTPNADAAKLRGERIEAALAILTTSEDYDLRKTLVQLYLEDNKVLEAGEQLLQAASVNSRYDAQGQERFYEVNTLLNTLKGKGLAAALQTKISEAQKQWLESKRMEDAAATQRQKEEAERARQEAEAQKKAQAAAPKAPGTTGTPPLAPTTGAATTGAATTGAPAPKTP